MRGNRKLAMLTLGLVSLLVLGALTAWGGLPTEALNTLSWSVVFLTGSGLGANVGAHMAQRPRSFTQIETTEPPVVVAPLKAP